jgi:hypothetical protein
MAAPFLVPRRQEEEKFTLEITKRRPKLAFVEMDVDCSV